MIDYEIFVEGMKDRVRENSKVQTLLTKLEEVHTFNNENERLTMGIILCNALNQIQMEMDTSSQEWSDIKKRAYGIEEHTPWTENQASLYLSLVIDTYFPMLHRLRPMDLPVCIDEGNNVLVSKTRKLKTRFHWPEIVDDGMLPYSGLAAESDWRAELSKSIRNELDEVYPDKIIHLYVPLIVSPGEFISIRYALPNDLPDPNSPKLGPQ